MLRRNVCDMASASAAHWDRVYADQDCDQVSWYQTRPMTSLRLIAKADLPAGRAVDVGAGESTLADELLAAGWDSVTLLDVSQAALADARQRLGDYGHRVEFVATDVLSWKPQQHFDVWHDRAVFHFLTEPAQQRLYVATAARAVRSGGSVVIGTFADDGPIECSGLPTARYAAETLVALLRDDFTPMHFEREEHLTPTGTVQPFTWLLLSRR